MRTVGKTPRSQQHPGILREWLLSMMDYGGVRATPSCTERQDGTMSSTSLQEYKLSPELPIGMDALIA